MISRCGIAIDADHDYHPLLVQMLLRNGETLFIQPSGARVEIGLRARYEWSNRRALSQTTRRGPDGL
jgi:hypothetical protein